MCQRKEAIQGPGMATAGMVATVGMVEEAAPISKEEFDNLRPVLNDAALLQTGKGKVWKKVRKQLQAKKKGMPIPPGMTFLYYGQPTYIGTKEAGARGHRGVMTVAVMQEPALPGKILLGFAFCNAGDPRKKILPDPYCKTEGRDKAMERLFDDPVVVPYLYEPRRMAEYVAGAVAVHEFERLSQYGVQLPPGFAEKVPHWTKGLPQRMKARKMLKRMKRPPKDAKPEVIILPMPLGRLLKDIIALDRSGSR